VASKVWARRVLVLVLGLLVLLVLLVLLGLLVLVLGC
jgi:hypothetical protein